VAYAKPVLLEILLVVFLCAVESGCSDYSSGNFAIGFFLLLFFFDFLAAFLCASLWQKIAEWYCAPTSGPRLSLCVGSWLAQNAVSKSL